MIKMSFLIFAYVYLNYVIMLNLWMAKKVKMAESEGWNNPKLKGMIRERLLDQTKTLEMKGITKDDNTTNVNEPSSAH